MACSELGLRKKRFSGRSVIWDLPSILFNLEGFGAQKTSFTGMQFMYNSAAVLDFGLPFHEFGKARARHTGQK
jgi:hypothetical protein